MKTHRIGSALLLLAFFLGGGEALQPQSQNKPMDEWKALEISLKGAKSIHPKDGFVPDESTAIKMGEAAAVAQYGKKTIAGERPFRAQLSGETWIVKGTLHPQGALGGTAVIKLSKADGRILLMIHQE
jgi:NTF2 fold immunity protein